MTVVRYSVVDITQQSTLQPKLFRFWCPKYCSGVLFVFSGFEKLGFSMKIGRFSVFFFSLLIDHHQCKCFFQGLANGLTYSYLNARIKMRRNPSRRMNEQLFSTLKFCLEKLFCGVFSRVKRVKKSTIQLFQSRSQYRT